LYLWLYVVFHTTTVLLSPRQRIELPRSLTGVGPKTLANTQPFGLNSQKHNKHNIDKKKKKKQAITRPSQKSTNTPLTSNIMASSTNATFVSLIRSISGLTTDLGRKITRQILDALHCLIPVDTDTMDTLVSKENGQEGYLLSGPAATTHIDVSQTMALDREAYHSLSQAQRTNALTSMKPKTTRSGTPYGLETTTVTNTAGEEKSVSVTAQSTATSDFVLNLDGVSYNTTPAAAEDDETQKINLYVLAVAIARYSNPHAADTFSARDAIYYLQWFIGENKDMEKAMGGHRSIPLTSKAPGDLATRCLVLVPKQQSDALITMPTLVTNGFRLLKYIRDEEQGNAHDKIGRAIRALAALANEPRLPGDTPMTITNRAIAEYQKYASAKLALGLPVNTGDSTQCLAFDSLVAAFRGTGTDSSRDNPAYGILLLVENTTNLHGRSQHALKKLQSIVLNSSSKNTPFVKSKKQQKPKKPNKLTKQTQGKKKQPDTGDAPKQKNQQSGKINEMNNLFRDYFHEGLQRASDNGDITKEILLDTYNEAIDASGFGSYTYTRGTKIGESLSKPLGDMMKYNKWFFTYVPEDFRDEIMTIMDIDVETPDAASLNVYQSQGRDRGSKSKSFAATTRRHRKRGGKPNATNQDNDGWSRHGSHEAEDAMRQLALERSYDEMQRNTTYLEARYRALRVAQESLTQENASLRVAFSTSSATASIPVPATPAPDNHIQQLQTNTHQALQNFKDEPGDLTASVLAEHAEKLLESTAANELTF
jgi:hypothetical protein